MNSFRIGNSSSGHLSLARFGMVLNMRLCGTREMLMLLVTLFVLRFTDAPIHAQAMSESGGIPWSAMITRLPSPKAIVRVELRHEGLNTEQTITSTNKAVIALFVTWLGRERVFDDDSTWREPAAPVLVARVWLRGKDSPKYILVHWKWKDTRGKMRTVTVPEVDLLMSDIMTASQQPEKP